MVASVQATDNFNKESIKKQKIIKYSRKNIVNAKQYDTLSINHHNFLDTIQCNLFAIYGEGGATQTKVKSTWADFTNTHDINI